MFLAAAAEERLAWASSNSTSQCESASQSASESAARKLELRAMPGVKFHLSLGQLGCPFHTVFGARANLWVLFLDPVPHISPCFSCLCEKDAEPSQSQKDKQNRLSAPNRHAYLDSRVWKSHSLLQKPRQHTAILGENRRELFSDCLHECLVRPS